jgi:beta-1,4-mannosyl-glycoprotein beta-1,4-N-acetylglucosaminyltransferase
MKIVDCFTFYNELDMLKFRLEYLYNTVDYFVLVEATVTHSGNPKPLFFEDNKSIFSKYLDKIVHVVVNDMPKNEISILLKRIKHINSTKRREIFQRKCIQRGIEKLSLQDDDIIIISDCDEIPNRNILKDNKIDKVYSLVQDLYYYNPTFQDKNKWTQSKICDYNTYKFYKNDTQFIRMIQTSNLIYNGGWHFSYFGNIDFIVNKLRNFCHYDWFENMSYDEIKNRIESGKFLLDSTELIKIPISENKNLPEGYEILIQTT